MERAPSYDVWESIFPPDIPLCEPFVPCSFALFRPAGRVWDIVASRAPTRAWDVGCDLFHDLAISPDTLSFLTESGEMPAFVETRHGIGFFVMRYRRCAGLFLFVHIHAPRASVARVLNAGALECAHRAAPSLAAYGAELRREDEAAYQSLIRALSIRRTICADYSSGVMPNAGRRSMNNGFDHGEGVMSHSAGLSDCLTEIAMQTGCRLIVESIPSFPVYIFRPELYEAWWLTVCSLAFSRGLTRSARFSLSSHNGQYGGRLLLRVTFPVIMEEQARLPRSRAEKEAPLVLPSELPPLTLLEQIASWNGAAASHALSAPYRCPDEPHLILSDLTAELTYLSDPTQTPGDMKAGILWKG